ncbi:hypothetical protein [Streptococcus sp. E17BB]|uniref:hypothetical protein n=1 Tax=Streptococcus sp. E17BB TaxID=3278714 RepID=UPI00359D6E4D
MSKKFSAFYLFLMALSIFIQPISIVKALEFSGTDSVRHSSLFTEIKAANPDKVEQSYFENNYIITMLVGENGIVLATDIYNLETHDMISSTSVNNRSIIETTDNTGLVSRQEFVKESVGRTGFRHVYDDWQYTGLAVPAGAVANLANAGFTATTAFLAGWFGVAVSVIHGILAFMGIGWSIGEMLATSLDTDGNGWIALHKRARRAYRGGSIVSYDHKTT